jgi:hypothetical protein
MGKYILILAALLTAAFAPARRGVDDPGAFVQHVYADYQRAGGERQVEWPAHAYSPRLMALFNAYDRWAEAHDDLVGSLDFDWWINAQDWDLHDVAVSARATGPGRMMVTARFRNGERHEEIRFRPPARPLVSRRRRPGHRPRRPRLDPLGAAARAALRRSAVILPLAFAG